MQTKQRSKSNTRKGDAFPAKYNSQTSTSQVDAFPVKCLSQKGYGKKNIFVASLLLSLMNLWRNFALVRLLIQAAKPGDGDCSPVADDDEKMCEGVVDKSAMSPDGERSELPDDGKRNVDGDHVDLDPVRAFKRTRHCPACESGMSAPEIGHNAECKRSRPSVMRGLTTRPVVLLNQLLTSLCKGCHPCLRRILMTG